MFLLVNPSKKDQINLTLFDNMSVEQKAFSGRNKELLSSIDTFLELKELGKEDVKGIVVVVGVGSFTSTRIACVVANTFGHVLHIPLLAIEKNQVDNVQSLIPTLLEQTPGKYISASYSGNPTITKSKG